MSPVTMADVPLIYRQLEDPDAIREAILLAPSVEAQASAWLVRWLADGLESAGDFKQLYAAWSRVLRYGHSVPRADLLEVMVLRSVWLRRYEARVRARAVKVW